MPNFCKYSKYLLHLFCLKTKEKKKVSNIVFQKFVGNFFKLQKKAEKKFKKKNQEPPKCCKKETNEAEDSRPEEKDKIAEAPTVPLRKVIMVIEISKFIE